MTDQPKSRVRTIYIILGVNMLLLLILIVTLGYVSTLRGKVDQTNAQQRGACQRGNLIRAASNYSDSVQQSFLAQAAKTREEQADLDRVQGDRVAEKINRDAAAAYRALSTGFVPLPIIQCEVIYP